MKMISLSRPGSTAVVDRCESQLAHQSRQWVSINRRNLAAFPIGKFFRRHRLKILALTGSSGNVPGLRSTAGATGTSSTTGFPSRAMIHVVALLRSFNQARQGSLGLVDVNRYFLRRFTANMLARMGAECKEKTKGLAHLWPLPHCLGVGEITYHNTGCSRRWLAIPLLTCTLTHPIC